MNTCPKCGSPQVEEQTNYAKETGRTWWVCGTFKTRDFHPQHSELCLEREEKNVLQRKLDDLQDALQMCVFWAESVSRRVTEDRESINWTGLQKAREVLGRLTDHKADAYETQGLRDELADVKRERYEARQALREIRNWVQRAAAWDNPNNVSGSLVAIEDICEEAAK